MVIAYRVIGYRVIAYRVTSCQIALMRMLGVLFVWFVLFSVVPSETGFFDGFSEKIRKKASLMRIRWFCRGGGFFALLDSL